MPEASQSQNDTRMMMRAYEHRSTQPRETPKSSAQLPVLPIQSALPIQPTYNTAIQSVRLQKPTNTNNVASSP